jgi:hypothetical protein
MEQLLGNDEKFDAERAYNSLQVQKKILFFFAPLSILSLNCCSIYSSRYLMQKELTIHWHVTSDSKLKVIQKV